ncbi:MAG: hypothetical protein ACOCUU_02410 [Nanoarchaeota archaeon]
MEREVKEKYVKKILKITEKHFKRYKYRKRTIRDLDKLCGL